MKVIKKIENCTSTEAVNALLIQYPDYGVGVEALYDHDGYLSIMGIHAEDFVEKFSENDLVLNIHLNNQRKRSRFNREINQIASVIAKLKKVRYLLLSSCSLSRETLEKLREEIVSIQEFSLQIKIASVDDIENSYHYKKGDMIYSNLKNNRFPGINHEPNRLIHYLNHDIPVLLNWNQREKDKIIDIIKETNDTDNLLILAKRAKEIRRTIRKKAK